jgi:CheY-like chemotaxis protein
VHQVPTLQANLVGDLYATLSAPAMPIQDAIDLARFLEAGSATEALIYLQSRSVHINVMLSDVKMPGDMDGIELADWARGHCPHVRILLMSGWHDHHNYDGRHKIVQNPFVFNRLLTKIRELPIRA